MPLLRRVVACGLAALLVLGEAQAAYTPSGLELIEEITASSSATVEFKKGIDTVHKLYVIEYWGVRPATDITILELHASTNGGSTWDTGNNYEWSMRCTWSVNGPAYGVDQAAATNRIALVDTAAGDDSEAGNGTYEDGAGTIYVYDPAAGSKYTRFRFSTMYVEFNGVPTHVDGNATYKVTTAVNALRFRFSSGNIAAGTFRLYGIR